MSQNNKIQIEEITTKQIIMVEKQSKLILSREKKIKEKQSKDGDKQ